MSATESRSEVNESVSQDAQPAVAEIFVFLNGKLRLTVSKAREEKNLLLLTRTGDIAGAVKSGTMLPYTLRSSGDSKVLRIPAADFEAFGATNPEFAEKVSREMALIDWQYRLLGTAIGEAMSSPNNLRLILTHAELMRLEKGQVVPQMWTSHEVLSVVLSGRLTGWDGEVLKPGEHLSFPLDEGEEGPRRNDFPEALEACEILLVDTKNLGLLFHEFAGIEVEAAFFHRP